MKELSTLHFSQFLPLSMEDAIQDLFYFHPDQRKYNGRILSAISQHGKPELVSSEAGLTFQLSNNLNPQQTLFVHRKQPNSGLIAIVIWVKQESTMNLAHLVLNKSFTLEENEQNFKEIILGLKKMSSIFKGIDAIGLAYSKKKLPLTKIAAYFD